MLKNEGLNPCWFAKISDIISTSKQKKNHSGITRLGFVKVIALNYLRLYFMDQFTLTWEQSKTAEVATYERKKNTNNYRQDLESKLQSKVK